MGTLCTPVTGALFGCSNEAFRTAAYGWQPEPNRVRRIAWRLPGHRPFWRFVDGSQSADSPWWRFVDGSQSSDTHTIAHALPVCCVEHLIAFGFHNLFLGATPGDLKSVLASGKYDVRLSKQVKVLPGMFGDAEEKLSVELQPIPGTLVMEVAVEPTIASITAMEAALASIPSSCVSIPGSCMIAGSSWANVNYPTMPGNVPSPPKIAIPRKPIVIPVVNPEPQRRKIDLE